MTALPLRFCTLWLCLALCACQNTAPADAGSEPLRHLLQLMSQRLLLAPAVAQSKWNSGGAIDDPVRERQILQALAKQAQAYGVDEARAVVFFQTQFDAGKLWQRELHAQWRAQRQPAFATAPDLAGTVRPQLDALTPQLLTTLQATQASLCNAENQRWLQHEGAQQLAAQIPPAAKNLALEALRCESH